MKNPCRAMGVVLLGGLVGCQAVIGLDEGKKRPAGEGGASGSGSAASSASSGSGGQAGGGSSSGSGNVVGASSSSSSGGTGGGGTGGGGVVSILPINMIDDMEHQSGLIITQANRVGSWFTYNDATMGATQSPVAGAMCLPVLGGYSAASKHSQHTMGSGFSTWGAGLGFDLNHPGAGAKSTYDVSKFAGIAFWAKGDQTIEFKVVTTETAPTTDAGTCMPVGPKGCGDSYEQQIALTPSWAQYVINFKDPSFKQAGWGVSAAFNPKSVLGAQFAVDQTVQSFEFWIDDIGFF